MLVPLLALILSLSPTARLTDHVRFIVTGDDRSNTNSPRPGLDENGVNVAGLGRIVKAILAEKPDAVVLNGDLVAGADTDEAEASQFDTWFKAMDPVYDAGIRVITMRGNHEMHCPHADDVWHKAMSGKHANPENGPAGEAGMTFTSSIRNVMLVVLDVPKSPDAVVNQTWLDSVLKGSRPQHVFAFTHKMAFFSGNHTDGMWTAMPQRDSFMKSLKEAGIRAAFFGHDHLYDHVAAKLPGWSDDQSVHQFVIGTAGAPFVKGKALPTTDGDWALTRVTHVEQALGYCVVDVDGSKVTIVYKSEKAPGDFETADTFTYSAPASS